MGGGGGRGDVAPLDCFPGKILHVVAEISSLEKCIDILLFFLGYLRIIIVKFPPLSRSLWFT